MKTMAYLARAFALLWAGFWMFFFLAESLVWHTPLGRMTIWVAVGVAFAIIALMAWRWEVAGGLALMVVGVLAALAYGIFGPLEVSVSTRVTALLSFGIPPVTAGALFLMHHHRITRLGVRG